MNQLKDLDPRRTPPTDLWPGIESRLRPRRRRWQPARLAMAASVVLAVGAVALWAGRPQPVCCAFPEAGPELARSPELPPVRNDSDRALVRANLQIAAIAESQLLDALAQDPESRQWQQMLESTRRRQQTLQAML